MIYFVQTGDRVKIGYDSDPWRRIKQLKTASPHDIRVLGVRDGSIASERELHARFAPYRVTREWFRLEGELKDFVDTECRPLIKGDGNVWLKIDLKRMQTQKLDLIAKWLKISMAGAVEISLEYGLDCCAQVVGFFTSQIRECKGAEVSHGQLWLAFISWRDENSLPPASMTRERFETIMGFLCGWHAIPLRVRGGRVVLLGRRLA